MKKSVIKTSFLIVLVFFTANLQSDASGQNYREISKNKHETMKSVLQALEEGREYDSTPSWREREYGFSYDIINVPDFDFDFDWDFPEIRINEEFINNMEKKLEIMEIKMQQKFRELEEKLDSLNERWSGKYDEMI